jgi:F-type H+-transporting ATPase subunit alpha
MATTLGELVTGWDPDLDAALAGATPVLDEVGCIESLGDGVAWVSGLPSVRLDELLRLPNGTLAVAMILAPERVGCLVLGEQAGVAAGDTVHATGALARVPVGDALFGRVLDPLGRPLDDEPAPEAEAFLAVERPAPSITERDLVVKPLYTGIAVIDAMFPIGRGQRELIIGDRATGKTSIGLEAIVAQAASDVACVYVSIGQRSSSVRQVVEAVRARGPFDRTVFIVAEAQAPPGLQWIAPYAATSIAEHVRDRGGDVLLVIDDLTKHAAVHRQIALLLRQPPGREAYPGDVFWLHARLLERAARLSVARGGGSLTVLPIAETQAGNLSAYVPTNLISITDGQIYLDARLFEEGTKPAVDVGRSVSRVGGKTQAPAMRKLAGTLRLEYAQFLELEMFTRFGTTADDRTRRTVARGQRIRELLNQGRLAPVSPGVQIAQLLAVARGTIDRLEPSQVPSFQAALRARLESEAARILAQVERSGDLPDADADALELTLSGLVDEILASPGPGPEPGA